MTAARTTLDGGRGWVLVELGPELYTASGPYGLAPTAPAPLGVALGWARARAALWGRASVLRAHDRHVVATVLRG